MVERKEIEEVVTAEMAADTRFADMNLKEGDKFNRPETDLEVAARDPEAILIDDTVTQDMFDSNPMFKEANMTVGETFKRLETDEEAAARVAAAEPKAGNACKTDDGKDGVLQADAGGHLVCVVEEADVDTDADADAADTTAATNASNGERHPLA